MNNYKPSEENEKNFTLPKNNDTIKLQNGAEKLGKAVKQNSPEIKTTVPNDIENKPKVNEPAQNISSSANSLIPKEKKEQERLKRATGTYDLKKADLSEISKHLKLKEKTPDDYYGMSVPLKELNKRLDNEAFGPKTDFSVWNFENNYDKLNKEEQSMLVHKMQLDLNNQGYKDYNGHSLKPDGIFGKKTESAYEQYKNDNKDELEDYEPNDKKIVEGEDYSVLKDNNGNPVLLASRDMNLNGGLVSNFDNEITNNPYAPKKLEILPIDFENKEAKKRNQNIDEISKYSTTVQAEILKLKVAWYMAETQEEKDAIHEEANRIRALADSGWGYVLDTAKSITGAAADEFAWLFGGDSSRAERDFWLTQLQKFDPTIEIEEKETLRSLMFMASILSPSPDDAWKMISKKASKDMLKTIGQDGAERFYKAMTKQAAKVNDNGIKKLAGKGVRIGNKYYQYEVKVISSKIGKYRLLGNIDNSGNLVLEVFEKMH